MENYLGKLIYSCDTNYRKMYSLSKKCAIEAKGENLREKEITHYVRKSYRCFILWINFCRELFLRVRNQKGN